MVYEFGLKEIQPQPCLYIREKIKTNEIGSQLGEFFPAVWQYAQSTGAQIAGMPYARWHQCDATNADMEAGITLALPAEGSGRIESGLLPGGQAAFTWHIGHYDELPNAYQALSAWMEEHGFNGDDAPWEVYWTDPGEVADPNEWRTEIIWLLG